MQDLYEIMEKMNDAKYRVESLRCVTELLMAAYEAQEAEEMKKVLYCIQSMLKAAEQDMNEALEMVDNKIMKEKQN